MGAVNACQNAILNKDKIAYTHPLAFCIEWFRSRRHIINVPNQSTTKLVAQEMSKLQGTTPVEKCRMIVFLVG